MLRERTLGELSYRIFFLLGIRNARSRPDGYWDYEPDVEIGYADRPRMRDRVGAPVRGLGNQSKTFPALEGLKALLQRVPEQTVVAIVLPQ